MCEPRCEAASGGMKSLRMDASVHDLSYYVGNAGEFPVLGEWDFFNHAGVCPLPRVGGEALREFALQHEGKAYVDSGFYRRKAELLWRPARRVEAFRERSGPVQGDNAWR